MILISLYVDKVFLLSHIHSLINLKSWQTRNNFLISTVLTDQVLMMVMMMVVITTTIIIYIDLLFLTNWISCIAFWDKSCKLPTVHNKDIISGRSGTVGFCAALWCLESWTHILSLISSENKFGGSCFSLCSSQYKCSHSSVQLAFSV